MRLFITGGAGFIGSTFTRLALAGGLPLQNIEQVTVYDALTYAGTLTNLYGCEDDPRFTFIRGDVCDAQALAQALPGHDVIVHFAAESHVDRSIHGATDFVRTNIEGTATLLTVAAEVCNNLDRIIHISTDEVYGSIPTGSWPETDPVNPTSPYAASKAGSDLIALSFFRSRGLPVLVTRCSNNYGPHQFPEKIIPLFVTNLMEGKHVPVYGDGSARRDWLHVDDHCRGIALAIMKGQGGEIYNIGGGTELSALELTRALVSACGASEEVIDFVADRPAHDMRYCVDCSKAEEELGYAPLVPFTQGLQQTIAWYQAHREWWEPLRAAAPSMNRLADIPAAKPTPTGE